MKRFAKILCVALLSLVGLWLLAGVALSAYFYLAAPESPVVNDSDLRIAEVAVPDEENAYAAFLSVTNLLDCSSEDKSVLSAYSMYCDGRSKPFSFWRKDGTLETCRAEVVKREYVNFGCWMLDKIGDTMSMDELPAELCTVCPCASNLVRIPVLVRFAYNKEMVRQDLVNVFRAGLADRDVEEFVQTPRSFLQPNFVGRIMARCVTPAFKDMRRHLKESLFALRAARTAVAIRRYGRANGGAIPSDLSALVPTYLAEVPRDPFAPDRALGYDATSRQLWTVGPDGDFNALDYEHTAKIGSMRKRAKYASRLDGRRIE